MARTAYVSLADKTLGVEAAERLHKAGFAIWAPAATANEIRRKLIPAINLHEKWEEAPVFDLVYINLRPIVPEVPGPDITLQKMLTNFNINCCWMLARAAREGRLAVTDMDQLASLLQVIAKSDYMKGGDFPEQRIVRVLSLRALELIIAYCATMAQCIREVLD